MVPFVMVSKTLRFAHESTRIYTSGSDIAACVLLLDLAALDAPSTACVQRFMEDGALCDGFEIAALRAREHPHIHERERH